MISEMKTTSKIKKTSNMEMTQNTKLENEETAFRRVHEARVLKTLVVLVISSSNIRVLMIKRLKGFLTKLKMKCSISKKALYCKYNESN